MDYDSEVGNGGFILSSSQTILLLMPKNVPVKVLRGVKIGKLLWYFNAVRLCNRKSTKIFVGWEILLTRPFGMVSKCAKDAEDV